MGEHSILSMKAVLWALREVTGAGLVVESPATPRKERLIVRWVVPKRPHSEHLSFEIQTFVIKRNKNCYNDD